jgi:hypothetical protein
VLALRRAGARVRAAEKLQAFAELVNACSS